jgi:DNA-directed RNA polymerase subunit RPC12/RpoP
MAQGNDESGGVLVQVCLECGKQYFFDDHEPQAGLTCEKCGNGVFRSFFAERRPGEASRDFTETTERDVRTDDPATDVTRGDLQDLNNL